LFLLLLALVYERGLLAWLEVLPFSRQLLGVGVELLA
jgi:hypothetical protein